MPNRDKAKSLARPQNGSEPPVKANMGSGSGHPVDGRQRCRLGNFLRSRKAAAKVRSALIPILCLFDLGFRDVDRMGHRPIRRTLGHGRCRCMHRIVKSRCEVWAFSYHPGAVTQLVFTV
jgi:hypothetical protein